MCKVLAPIPTTVLPFSSSHPEETPARLLELLLEDVRVGDVPVVADRIRLLAVPHDEGLRVGEDRTERLVEFMGERARKFAERRDAGQVRHVGPLQFDLGLDFLAFFSAAAVFPWVLAAGYPLPDSAVDYVLVVAGEVLIGLTLGFLMSMIFAVFQMAGELLGLQVEVIA
mgnify:CR=1 FL=1